MAVTPRRGQIILVRLHTTSRRTTVVDSDSMLSPESNAWMVCTTGQFPVIWLIRLDADVPRLGPLRLYTRQRMVQVARLAPSQGSHGTSDYSQEREDLTLDLKSAAQFHLQKLVPDERFNDSTLVVVPCNSPEQVPISLGTSGMIFDGLGRWLTSNDRLCPRAASHLAAIQRHREGLPILRRR